MIRAIVLAAALFLTGIAGYAQTPPHGSMKIGGTILALGATQASVLQQLGKYYDLSEVQGSQANASSWIIAERGKPKILIANVYFKNGKLSSVLKYWTMTEPDTEAAFANLLYGAVQNFEREGRTLCIIHTAEQQEPNLEEKAVFLTCGEKRLEIAAVKVNGHESGAITEVMQSSTPSR